jgi:hypothetical protein
VRVPTPNGEPGAVPGDGVTAVGWRGASGGALVGGTATLAAGSGEAGGWAGRPELVHPATAALAPTANPSRVRLRMVTIVPASGEQSRKTPSQIDHTA